MNVAKTTSPDPLYVIFEQHLFTFQDSDADRKAFIGNVVSEYLTYLRKMNIIIPHALENAVIEELGNQVNTMLVKKIYGCLSIDEFQRGLKKPQKKTARKRYSKIAAK